MRQKATLIMSKKITILLLVSLFLLLVFYARKPTIAKEKEFIMYNSNLKKNKWYQYYLMSNPPSDTIECHKLILKYADSLGVSLDSLKNNLKKTGIGSYNISFYNYTIWGKVYHLFTGEYSYKSSNYLGEVNINTAYRDRTKWQVWFGWNVEDEYYGDPDGYKRYFLDLVDEYDPWNAYRQRDDPRAVYYRELQEQKKQKP